jgi:hypothetical protein
MFAPLSVLVFQNHPTDVSTCARPVVWRVWSGPVVALSLGPRCILPRAAVRDQHGITRTPRADDARSDHPPPPTRGTVPRRFFCMNVLFSTFIVTHPAAAMPTTLPPDSDNHRPRASDHARLRIGEEPFTSTSGLYKCGGWENSSLAAVLERYRNASDRPPVQSWQRDDKFCALGQQSRWECTPTGLRLRRPELRARSACTVLRQADAQRVLFYGESTTRHAFWGLVLLLTNDFSSPQPGGYPADCEWAAEIGVAMRPACRSELDDINVTVCGGVELRFHQFFSPPKFPSMDELEAYDVVVWGWQGHAARITYRWARLGVNDAAALDGALERHCRNPRYASLASSRVILLNNHPRFVWQLMKTQGECPDAVAKYHVQLPQVWRRQCNVKRVASAWDAVLALVADPGTNWSQTSPPGAALGVSADTSLAGSWWRKQTVDGVHWGTAINLHKAYAILEQIEARWGRSKSGHHS